MSMRRFRCSLGIKRLTFRLLLERGLRLHVGFDRRLRLLCPPRHQQGE
jgi:hypothetical protein